MDIDYLCSLAEGGYLFGQRETTMYDERHNMAALHGNFEIDEIDYANIAQQARSAECKKEYFLREFESSLNQTLKGNTMVLLFAF